MEKRTKTWITIIVSVLAVIVMLGVAAIGGTAYWVYSHVHTETVAQETAGDSFSRARARFSGQQPLIEIRDRDQVVIHRSDAAAATGEIPKLTTLHAMVYDPDEGRMVN